MEENNNSGMLKPAFSHALIISAVLIILTLILYLAGQMQNKYMGYLSIAISIVGIVYAIFNYRNQNRGGYISYGQVLGYGVLVGLIIGVLTGLFTFLLYGVISPELVEEARLNAERELYRSNPDLPYEQAEMLLKFQYWFITPTGLLIAGIIGGAFQGLLISLVTGIFAKKNEPDAFIN